MQLDQQAYEAASKGYTTQLCQLIEQGATDVDYMATGAAEGGYRQLLYALTGESYKLLASSFPTILAEAMRGTSIEQLYESRYSVIKEELATFPHEIPLKLVVILANKSIGYANDYEAIACGAARRGHTDIVNKYLPKVSDINSVAYCAARGGYTLLVDELIAKGADDIDYIIRGAIDGHYSSLVKKLRKLPKKVKEPVPRGFLSGLEQVPQGVLRQYLQPYLSRRQKETMSVLLEDIKSGHQAKMQGWSLARLAKYVDDYPHDRVALELLTDKIEKNPEAGYQVMMHYDYPALIDFYPDEIDSLFHEALKQKKGRILTALIDKYGLERFEQPDN